MDYAAAVDVFFTEPPGSSATPAGPSPTPARVLRDALEPVAMHGVPPVPAGPAQARRRVTPYRTARRIGRCVTPSQS